MASLNASNLFDRHYIASCTGQSYCYWGAGRMVLVGIKYQW
jgi:iron complex outermembrane receptor protein